MWRTKSTVLFFFALCFHLVLYTQNLSQDTIQARSYRVKADSLSKHADYDGAIDYYKEASKIYQKHRLWEHYLKTENIWGDILRIKGLYERAIAKMERALAMAKRHRLLQSPDAAMSHNNIGIIYYELGKYDQALAQHQKALKIDIAHFGEQHPDVASCYNNIGNPTFSNSPKTKKIFSDILSYMC